MKVVLLETAASVKVMEIFHCSKSVEGVEWVIAANGVPSNAGSTSTPPSKSAADTILNNSSVTSTMSVLRMYGLLVPRDFKVPSPRVHRLPSECSSDPYLLFGLPSPHHS